MIALWLLLTPVIAVLLIAFVPSKWVDTVFAFLSSIANFVLAVVMMFVVNQNNFQVMWLEKFGIYFALDGGGGSSLLILTANLVMIPVIIYASTKIKKQTGVFLTMLLIMQAGLNGIFLAKDLVLFYIFWEITFIPSLIMLFVWGREKRREAAYSYLVYAMTGSLLMLMSILALKPLSGAESYLFSDLLAVTPNLALSTQNWLFLGFVFAFAVKTPLIPVHSWLIGFHEQNHPSGVADVAGTLYKVGAWGFFAWALPLLPGAAEVFSPFLLALAAVTALYAAWLATYQTNLKRLLAYASLSHMGIVAAGVFALHITGLNGAIYLLAAQMVSTGALFLISGMLFERQKSFELEDYGGAAKSAPALAAITLFILFASIGVPGLANFPGEFLSLLGTFQQNPYLAALACGAIIAAGVYGVNLYQRLYQGEETSPLAEIKLGEVAILAPLLIMIIYLGVLPHKHLQDIEVQASTIAEQHEDMFTVKHDTPNQPKPQEGGH